MKFFGILAFAFLALVAVVVADVYVQRDELLSTCSCKYAYYPICGSDNYTYANHCTFHCVQKKLLEKGVNLAIQKYGYCSGV